MYEFSGVNVNSKECRARKKKKRSLSWKNKVLRKYLKEEEDDEEAMTKEVSRRQLQPSTWVPTSGIPVGK